jgi:Xaa-Pro dipeptidase
MDKNQSTSTAFTDWQFPEAARTVYSKEYGKKRIQKVQKAIAKAGLDALVVTNRGLNSISYVSNFHPYPLMPGLALIPATGPTYLFVNTYSPAHTRALQSIIWNDEFIDVPHDPVSEGSNQNLVDECIEQIKKLRLNRGRIGFAGDEVDWILPTYCKSELPDARFEDANRMLTSVLAVKDEVEISLIRFAQRYLDEIAYPLYRQHLRPGAVDYEVSGKIMGALLERGAGGETWVLWDAGPPGAGTWASGVRGRKLEHGDIVLSEPTPNIAGYQSEKMYVFALGRDIPEPQRRGAQIVYDTYLQVMESLKPGQELTPIVERAEAYVRQHGYPGNTVPIGHWIGAQNHEGPRFTTEGTRDWVLEENMVMSWHPNLVVPGEVRATCSTCVLITEKGVEDLSSVKMEPIYYV